MPKGKYILCPYRMIDSPFLLTRFATNHKSVVRVETNPTMMQINMAMELPSSSLYTDKV